MKNLIKRLIESVSCKHIKMDIKSTLERARKLNQEIDQYKADIKRFSEQDNDLTRTIRRLIGWVTSVEQRGIMPLKTINIPNRNLKEKYPNFYFELESYLTNYGTGFKDEIFEKLKKYDFYKNNAMIPLKLDYLNIN